MHEPAVCRGLLGEDARIALDDVDPEAAERHLRSLSDPAVLMAASPLRPQSLTPSTAWLRQIWEAVLRRGRRTDG
jgi:hypothetical protein